MYSLVNSITLSDFVAKIYKKYEDLSKCMKN